MPQHRDPVGQRLALGASGQLINKRLDQERADPVRISAQAPGWQWDRHRHVFNHQMLDRIDWNQPGHRQRIALVLLRQRRARTVLIEQSRAEFTHRSGHRDPDLQRGQAAIGGRPRSQYGASRGARRLG